MKWVTDHVPAEIWRMVFHFACATPFMPFVDEGHDHLSTSIAFNSKLFLHEDLIPEEYEQLDATIATLRLVCRSWAATIDVLPRRYVFTDMCNIAFPAPYSKYLLAVEKLQVVPPYLNLSFFCQRGRFSDRLTRQCLDCEKHFKPRPNDIWKPDHTWLEMDDVTLQTNLTNVKVLFLYDVRRIDDVERILRITQNIRALMLHEGHFSLTFDALAAFFPKNLTHLALLNIRCNRFFELYSKSSMSMPYIQYLDLSFLHSNLSFITSSSPKPTVSPFPQLKTLKVQGYIDYSCKDFVEYFFIQCGHTVVEFLEGCSWGPVMTWTQRLQALPRWFPNLRIYGISFLQIYFLTHNDEQESVLASLPVYRPKGASFTLLLDSFSFAMRNIPIYAPLLSFIWRKWDVTEVMMTHKWVGLEENTRRLCHGDSSLVLNIWKEFFEFVKDKTDSFLDSDGVSLNNARFSDGRGWADLL
ncbi:hypothetical protein CPB86DRAFT_283019 [Serendipita vermifera]|nr:hypothetical protein CPB86DRAFT_283019 [Serendipita vermifera]